ncbi:MAG TPA: ATPase, T2SS/T4P/T4SS family [Candidatus Binatia bacterium]|jgi:type IV pilus assembly protein PilB
MEHMKVEGTRATAAKPKIGELLVQEGIITRAQLDEALAAQKKQPVYMPLGEICVDLKFISRDQLKALLTKHHKRIPLGELLTNLALVTPSQVQECLNEQKKSPKKKLGDLLIQKGYLNENALISALNMQLGVPKMAPHASLIDRALLKEINEAFLRKTNAIPAFKRGNELTVIMADPLDEATLRDMAKFFKCEIHPAIASISDIQNAINQCLHPEFRGGNAEANKDLVINTTAKDTSPDARDPAAVDIVNYIIPDAVRDGASDIHIEMQENGVRVRYRIDGVLHHKTDLPAFLAPSVTSRIKVLSGLDIAEKRRHQDGRIQAQVLNRNIDLRVSTYVSVYGESIVIRLLDRGTKLADINSLGLNPANRAKYEELLSFPTGVMLATGPTGSGKSTTLYASLNYLNNIFRKIITVEDPVELTIEGIVQGQFEPKMNLSYSDFIKSMMRQDPDVLMVGEIRDQVAAEAVIQAALTGHKVLSTLHTDDSTGALMRLVEMGIDPYLVTSTMLGVMSQRLLRILCQNCRQPYTPPRDLFSSFHIDPHGAGGLTFYQAKGCAACNGTGFKGRTGIHELLIVNDAIREGVLSHKTSTQLRAIARQQAGMISMREDGFYKATQGVTTLEEIIRVCFHNESDELEARSAKSVIDVCEGRGVQPMKASMPATPRAAMQQAWPAIDTRRDAAPPEGETYRVRFDVNTIESETERIADFFREYQRVKQMLGEPVGPELMGDFVDFVVDTARRLKTTEGADFAEFSLYVRDKRERLFVETIVSHTPRTRESALRQVGYLK